MRRIIKPGIEAIRIAQIVGRRLAETLEADPENYRRTVGLRRAIQARPSLQRAAANR